MSCVLQSFWSHHFLFKKRNNIFLNFLKCFLDQSSKCQTGRALFEMLQSINLILTDWKSTVFTNGIKHDAYVYLVSTYTTSCMTQINVQIICRNCLKTCECFWKCLRYSQYLWWLLPLLRRSIWYGGSFQQLGPDSLKE